MQQKGPPDLVILNKRLSARDARISSGGVTGVPINRNTDIQEYALNTVFHFEVRFCGDFVHVFSPALFSGCDIYISAVRAVNKKIL